MALGKWKQMVLMACEECSSRTMIMSRLRERARGNRLPISPTQVNAGKIHQTLRTLVDTDKLLYEFRRPGRLSSGHGWRQMFFYRRFNIEDDIPHSHPEEILDFYHLLDRLYYEQWQFGTFDNRSALSLIVKAAWSCIRTHALRRTQIESAIRSDSPAATSWARRVSGVEPESVITTSPTPDNDPTSFEQLYNRARSVKHATLFQIQTTWDNVR